MGNGFNIGTGGALKAKSPRPAQAGRGSLLNATNTQNADCYGYCYWLRLRHCAETELNALRRGDLCQKRAKSGRG